jgi:hypothetical protein
MTPEQFCTFLRGVFEMHDAQQLGKKKPTPITFNAHQAKVLRDNLNRVQYSLNSQADLTQQLNES